MAGKTQKPNKPLKNRAMVKKSPSEMIPAGGVQTDSRITQANRWREQYNPLRGLSMPLAISWLGQYMMGWMADIQWAYHFIEMTDADLFALLERRSSAILQLDWNIKIVEKEKIDEGLANDQAAALREIYEGIDNLYEAIEHLESATFRGYAHLEKHFADDGTLECLEICDQWNVVRNGIKGGWKYNPEARNTTFQALPEANLIDPANWIIRIVPRHVNRIGIIKFLRSNLSQKDWDGFIEQYGIPAWLIFGPPNVPLNKIADYEAAAEKIARGGSGYLPNGSTAMAADSPRGSSPFKEHLDYWQKQLILVGTGGLLTMLAESGSGTLAGAAHTDTFEQIARAEARKISSIMQRQLDRQILNNIWPGSPRLAYWELAANEGTYTGALIDQVLKLSQAGYQMSAEELSEKTGYSLTLKPSVGSGLSIGNVERGVEPQDVESAGEQPPEGEDAEMSNRAPGIVDHTFQEAVYKAAAMDLQPVRRRLERILQIDDPEILQTRLRALQREIESGQLLRDINADPASAKPMELLLAHSMQQGITKEKTHESKS